VARQISVNFDKSNGGGKWIVRCPILLTFHYIAVDLVKEEIKLNLDLVMHMVLFLQSNVVQDWSAHSNFGAILKPCIGLQRLTLFL
jgi:hypothetical protein